MPPKTDHIIGSLPLTGEHVAQAAETDRWIIVHNALVGSQGPQVKVTEVQHQMRIVMAAVKFTNWHILRAIVKHQGAEWDLTSLQAILEAALASGRFDVVKETLECQEYDFPQELLLEVLAEFTEYDSWLNDAAAMVWFLPDSVSIGTLKSISDRLELRQTSVPATRTHILEVLRDRIFYIAHQPIFQRLSGGSDTS